MLSLTRPSRTRIDAYFKALSARPFSYPEQGASDTTPPPGYRVDHNRIQIGQGEADFALAKTAMQRWAMFDFPWLTLCWPETPIQEGAVVGVLVSSFGVYTLNPCRIVYTIDEPRRYGFGYGTLPGHMGRGEERFLLEWHPDDGSVWYDVLAFSRPGTILAVLGYPYMRLMQRRFGRATKAAMREAVSAARSNGTARSGV